ncbi:hypothetical protein ANCCEY_00010 [Ancylostoma ceylanicum]|uniref:Serpentine receptor class gamma n=1 Tax=Ancylostoma ceylanicum TaxID=53326 RepID=A0A0D6MAS6_9BILA|nr:hypothetical protein ANCCEY_00010 [Ancylostoma ceylanicum]
MDGIMNVLKNHGSFGCVSGTIQEVLVVQLPTQLVVNFRCGRGGTQQAKPPGSLSREKDHKTTADIKAALVWTTPNGMISDESVVVREAFNQPSNAFCRVTRALTAQSLSFSGGFVRRALINMMPPLQIVMLVFTTVSMLTYAFILLSVERLKKHEPFLRGSFFRLCATNFLVDAIFYLEFTVLMRFRKYGLLNDFFALHPQLLTVVPPISIGLHYYIKMVVYLGEMSIAANRLTSAMRPITYEKIWSSSFLWQVRAAQFIIPMIVMLPIVLNPRYEFKYVIYASQNTLRLETDPASTEVLALVDMVSSTTATMASLFMYICTVIRIRQLFKEQLANVSSRRHDVLVPTMGPSNNILKTTPMFMENHWQTLIEHHINENAPVNVLALLCNIPSWRKNYTMPQAVTGTARITKGWDARREMCRIEKAYTKMWSFCTLGEVFSKETELLR